MPDFAISTVFKGKDQVSPKFKRMGKSAAMFGDSASDAFRRASRAGSRFGDVTKGVLAAGAIQRGLGLIQQGMSSVVTQFVEFDDAATAATIIYSTPRPARAPRRPPPSPGARRPPPNPTDGPQQ